MCLREEGRSGRDDWIRTSDLTHPKRARYQAALRPDRGGPCTAELEVDPARAVFDTVKAITAVREASRKRAACRADRAASCGSRVLRRFRCAAPKKSARNRQRHFREDGAGRRRL